MTNLFNTPISPRRAEIVTKRFLLRDFIPADEPASLTYRADPMAIDTNNLGAVIKMTNR